MKRILGKVFGFLNVKKGNYTSTVNNHDDCTVERNTLLQLIMYQGYQG